MASERKDIILGAKDETRGAISSAKSGLKSVGTTWLEVAKGMLAFDVFKQIGRAAIDFVKGSVDAFAQQEMAIAKLTQAMKNNGTFTQAALKDNLDFASSLQKITTYGDETIIEMQALLSSFGLHGAELKKATKATLDMAAATGTDLKAAALLTGKAFVGETGSLSRYGIVLDQGIPKTEKFAAAMGKMNEMFGGAAQAQANTFAGQIMQLGNEFGDVREEIGEKLMPVLRDELLPAFRESLPVIRDITVAMAQGATEILKFAVAVSKLSYEVGAWVAKHSRAMTQAENEVAKAAKRAEFNVREEVEAFRKSIAEKEKAKKATEELTEAKIDGIDKVVAREKQATDETEEEKKKRGTIEKAHSKNLIAETEGRFLEIKTRRDVDFQEQIVAWEVLLENEALVAEERKKIEETIWKLKADKRKEDEGAEKTRLEETKKLEEKEQERRKKALEDLTSAHESAFGAMADSQGDFAKASEASGKAMLSFLKNSLKKQVDAWGAAEAAKAWAAAPLSFGATLAALIPIAAAVAAGHAAIDAIRLKEGGIVTKPTRAIIGEEGPEAVIPLEKAMPIMGETHIHIHAGAFMGTERDAMAFAKIIDYYQRKISRRGMTVMP